MASLIYHIITDAITEELAAHGITTVSSPAGSYNYWRFTVDHPYRTILCRIGEINQNDTPYIQLSIFPISNPTDIFCRPQPDAFGLELPLDDPNSIDQIIAAILAHTVN